MPAAHSLVQELHESFSRKGYKRLVSRFPIPLSLAWTHDARCKPHTHGITIHRGLIICGARGPPCSVSVGPRAPNLLSCAPCQHNPGFLCCC